MNLGLRLQCLRSTKNSMVYRLLKQLCKFIFFIYQYPLNPALFIYLLNYLLNLIYLKRLRFLHYTVFLYLSRKPSTLPSSVVFYQVSMEFFADTSSICHFFFFLFILRTENPMCICIYFPSLKHLVTYIHGDTKK